MNRTIKQLIVVQMKEYWREPEVLFWTLGFPIMVASVLSLLYSFKPAVNYKAAIIEYHARTDSAIAKRNIPFTDTREIVIPGKSSRKISLERMTMQNAEKAYQSGKIEIIIEIKDGSTVQYYFDPANERTENLYLWIDHTVHENNDGIVSKIAPLSQRGSRYIDYLIPGLIALGIMNATLWGIGWTLIEFRIKKFLRRMIVTPMKKLDFMLSISLTRLLLSIIEAGILIIFAHYVFGVSMQGNPLVFAFVFLSGHVAFSGMSILMASRANNTRVANGLINIITMPMFLLSGVFFNYHSFPDWMITLIQYLPLTVLADSLRNVFLFGGGMANVIFPVSYLLTFGAVFYLLGLKMYRWY
ncbi:MAG: ABC transporter permease [Spirochaetia bacterium]|nr:ABC transporter permease [Spirochaetia bacterium]